MKRASMLPMFTIYRRAEDVSTSAEFVVRKWVVECGKKTTSEHVGTGATLSEARKHIPAGFVCTSRAAGEDPAIVETWL